MSDGIDLHIRPHSNFRPRALDRFLATKVKNEVLRCRLEAMSTRGSTRKPASCSATRG